MNNASPDNEYCYTCEPPAANETLNNFDLFPEPTFSPTWQAAVAYVTAGAASAPVQPVWDAGFINGQQWTDPNTGVSTVLPGSGLYNTLKRDPYADLVSLAVDLGAAGVDVDYEEMWHADMHKQGPAGGPWTLPQTVYKYAAVLKDVQLNIAAQAPALLLSSPTGAASGWAGNWWGGNLKGVVAGAAALYPDLIAFVARTGGINVMVRAAGIFAARARVLRWVLARQPAARRACVRVCAPRVCTPARLCTSTLLIPHASPPPRPQNLAKKTYDLSDDEQFYECPTPAVCSLHDQVAFYMETYSNASVPAHVGYETGTPAYPDPVEDATHQLPLTMTELGLITSNTQKNSPGGFFCACHAAASPFPNPPPLTAF